MSQSAINWNAWRSYHDSIYCQSPSCKIWPFLKTDSMYNFSFDLRGSKVGAHTVAAQFYEQGALLAGQSSILFLLWGCLPHSFRVLKNRHIIEDMFMYLFVCKLYGTVFGKISENKQQITGGNRGVKDFTSSHTDGDRQRKAEHM